MPPADRPQTKRPPGGPGRPKPANNYDIYLCMITAPVVFLSRNINYVSTKIVNFRYLKKCVLDRSIQNTIDLILKTEALHRT